MIWGSPNPDSSSNPTQAKVNSDDKKPNPVPAKDASDKSQTPLSANQSALSTATDKANQLKDSFLGEVNAIWSDVRQSATGEPKKKKPNRTKSFDDADLAALAAALDEDPHQIDGNHIPDSSHPGHKVQGQTGNYPSVELQAEPLSDDQLEAIAQLMEEEKPIANKKKRKSVKFTN